MPPKRKFQTIKGMRDILPQDQGLWKFVLDTAKEKARIFGFSEIETPILEQAKLFKRSVGEETDIVKKEMFSFTDQGKDELALRPEFTASICRAYIEHGLVNQPKPVKLFQAGPCFRYERPQAGRYRQFHQFNVEIIGLEDPAVDAEGIALAFAILQDLDIDTELQVNSIGTPESRRNYIKKLKKYYSSKKRYLCKDCKQRLKTNPLRLLDCKKKKCSEYAADAPQIVDHLDNESKDHFMKVLEYLDDFDLPYVLNPRIVRGLDYYTRTAFEILTKEDGKASKLKALGGGGRYDNLIGILGGRETPAFGFALGIERIIALLRDKNVKLPKVKRFDIFLAHLGREARKKIFKIFQKLKDKGYAVTFNLSRGSLRQQLENANKLKVKIALILGEKELSEDAILVKDMQGGTQESVSLDNLFKELDRRLK